MHKIKTYKKHKGVPIFRDYNIVDGEQVYIGNGQGCGTFWFRDVKEARKFIDKFREEMDIDHIGGVSLILGKLCIKCRSYYSYGTKEWKKAKDRVCEEYKEELKAKVK